MESLVAAMSLPDPSFWAGKRVLLTGHTGFKGAWMTLWLHRLGARVAGLSLAPITDPSLFEAARVAGLCAESRLIDIRDRLATAAMIRGFRPEIVLHLAAQPLVRASYREPVETFATNVQGTVHVLDALRDLDSVSVALMVTTDKVYRNLERDRPYSEDDTLGGADPYSASKAACELVIQSYRDSFLRAQGVRVASARAGNVIGGGDWSEDRLIPDAVRAWQQGRVLEIRRPGAVRPWQHVLEPLSGYLWLAARLLASPAGLHGEAFNFGPPPRADHTVGELLQSLQNHWPGAAWVRNSGQARGSREARLLNLSGRKARAQLQWLPSLSFRETAALTGEWYDCWHRKTMSPREASRRQIRAYTERARQAGIRWAKR